MRKTLTFILSFYFLMTGVLISTSKAGDGFSGSVHDIKKGPESCQLCHPPGSEIQILDVSVYVEDYYTSATMTSRPGQPSKMSALCLSCHDGVIASEIGPSIKDDHPISMNYSEASGMKGNPTLPLYDGKVECSSCHDVHNIVAQGPKLLRMSNQYSQLCLDCHDK